MVLIKFILPQISFICDLESQLQLWQAFVGARARRVEKYYQDLLGEEIYSSDCMEQHSFKSDNSVEGSNTDSMSVPEKWKGQIEKVTAYLSFELN